MQPTLLTHRILTSDEAIPGTQLFPHQRQLISPWLPRRLVCRSFGLTHRCRCGGATRRTATGQSSVSAEAETDEEDLSDCLLCLLDCDF